MVHSGNLDEFLGFTKGEYDFQQFNREASLWIYG